MCLKCATNRAFASMQEFGFEGVAVVWITAEDTNVFQPSFYVCGGAEYNPATLVAACARVFDPNSLRMFFGFNGKSLTACFAFVGSDGSLYPECEDAGLVAFGAELERLAQMGNSMDQLAKELGSAFAELTMSTDELMTLVGLGSTRRYGGRATDD